MKKYNKLVRDRIPEISTHSGKTYSAHTATKQEYWESLRAKLVEEVDEFLADESIEELADVLEVVHAIADERFGEHTELEKKRQEKAAARGGFSQRIILEHID